MVRLAIVDSEKTANAYAQAADRLGDARVCFTVGSHSVPTATACESWGSLLAGHADDFDAVIVREPVPKRLEEISDAVKNGKHVLCAAPFGSCPDDVDQVYAAAAEAGVCLMAERLFRYHPYSQTLEQALSEGKLGSPGLLRVHDWKPPPLTSSDQSQNETLFPWIDEHVAVANRLFNESPNCVFAKLMSIDLARFGVQIHLGFPSKGMALIDVGHFLPHSPSYFSMSLIGETGAVYADDHHNSHLVWRRDGRVGVPIGFGDEPIRLQLNAFLDAVAGNGAAHESRETRAAIAVSTAVLESSSRNGVACVRGGRYEFDA